MDDPEERSADQPIPVVQGPVEDTISYLHSRNSVLIAGALPQGLGIILTILWEPMVKGHRDAASNMMLSTVPLFVAGFLFALLCTLFFVFRKPSSMKVRGAWHGMALYSCIWMVTTIASCGWTISRFGHHFDLP